MGLNGFIQSLYRGIRERSSNFSYDVFATKFFQYHPSMNRELLWNTFSRKNAAIDEMIANLRAEIEFLTEYKQRLIADVVTGQVNVQNL